MDFNKNGKITLDGFDFEFDPLACHQCNGACCRGESGYIWVNYSEIEAISNHLKISVEEFSKRYLKRVKHRYSLIESKIGDDDYACIFFDLSKNRCKIYDVRPRQCKTYPFWDQYKNSSEEVAKECPGVSKK